MTMWWKREMVDLEVQLRVIDRKKIKIRIRLEIYNGSFLIEKNVINFGIELRNQI